MIGRRVLRSRLAALFAFVTAAGLLAACGSGPSAHSTTTTLPPLPPEVFGLVTLIGTGGAAGTGDSVERVQLSSVPPEMLPRIHVGEFPDAVAVAPDGKTAYVTSYTANTVTPIDLATGRAGRPVPAGNGPAGIAITPDGTTAYVTDAGTSPIGDTVTPIDLATGKAGSPITVGDGPQAIAITADGRMAYVTDAGAIVTGQSGPIGDTVTPIDLQTRRALPPITVGNAPVGIAIAGGTAYVANSGSESVSTINLATRTAGAAIPVGGSPEWIAISSEDAWVAVAKNTLPSANSLTPINLVSEAAGTPVTVGSAPSSVAIEGGTAWVVCSGSGTVVPVAISGAHPHAESAAAIPGGPYAIALYVVRAR
jgi:YVTN family beta-propeller protein